MKTPCPICGSDKNIVPINYGYPRAPDEINEELGVVPKDLTHGQIITIFILVDLFHLVWAEYTERRGATLRI
jgi:hypothetical protein